MNEYLVNLLLKIHNVSTQGGDYAYAPKDCSNSEDDRREEVGLLELKNMGYIEISKRKNNMIRRDSRRYLNILVDDISPKGNNFIREHLARENLQPLEETLKIVPDIYQQTLSHLAQARQHIFSIDDARSRKDALRDCLCGMEALIKQICGINDIRDGIDYLMRNNVGPNAILRDGRSTWDRIQELYPDIRHGNATASDISDAEALYWIERILAFVNYLSRVKEV